MQTSKLIRFLNYLTATIIVLVPFQALLTTWAGSNLGHLDLFRIWKELLLVPLIAGCLYLIYSDKKLKQWFTNSRLVLLIATYATLQFCMGAYALQTSKVNNSAVIYGVLINLRFFMFFLACLVLASKSDWLIKNWQKLIIWPAAIVVSFGLLQHFVLAKDFLRHFGYGPKTIPAYQAVDHKPQYARVQSTLRGPNPLGAYLVLIFTIVAAWLIRKKNWSYTILCILLAIVLFFTYSRSAWLGVIVSLGLLIYWLIKNQKVKRQILIAGIVLVAIGSLTILIWQKNSVVENTLFHTSQTSQSAESSNAVRTEAMLDGAKSVLHQPFGYGPGTAGPASVRNDHPPRIAENYFIQIGQEVGVIGLVIFIAINLYVAKLLWDRRQNDLALIALAALVGLTLVNCLSHAWADDTLAYVYWGVAGIALAPAAILNKERKSKHA